MSATTTNIQEITRNLDEVEKRLEAFGAAGAEVHGRGYAPGKWSGRQILAHVSDCGYVFFYRMLRGAAEGGDVVMFDHEVWAKELKQADRPVEVSLGMMRALFASTRHLLATLEPEALARTSQHPQRGAMAAADFAAMLANHTRHHAGQLDAIREGRAWTSAEAVKY